jgi:hypothetical protein
VLVLKYIDPVTGVVGTLVVTVVAEPVTLPIKLNPVKVVICVPMPLYIFPELDTCIKL